MKELEYLENSIQTSTPVVDIYNKIEEVALQCESENLQEGIARCFCLQGTYWTFRQDTDAAHNYYTKALAIGEQLVYYPVIADGTYGLAAIAYRKGCITEAYKLCKNSYAIAVENNLNYRLAQCKLLLAVISQVYSAEEEALDNFQSALTLSSGNGYLQTEGQVNFLLAEFYLVGHHFGLAKKCAEDSLKIYESLHFQERIVSCKLRLTTILIELKEVEHAESLLKEILPSIKDDASLQYATYLLCLGNLHKTQAHYSDAEAAFQKAVILFERLNHPRLIANGHLLLSENYNEGGLIDNAISSAETGYKYAMDMQEDYLISQALDLLYQGYKKVGDFSKALVYLESFNEKVKVNKEALLQKRIDFAELKIEYEKEHAAVEKERKYAAQLEQDIKHKEWQLKERTQHLLSQTESLSHFRDELQDILRQAPSEPAIRQIKQKINSLPLRPIDWEKFETEFAAVHPEFTHKLLERYPMLTPMEVKMCSLLRLNLKSHEIARLFCVTERAVEFHRLNIRKKCSIPKEQNLSVFLNAL